MTDTVGMSDAHSPSAAPHDAQDTHDASHGHESPAEPLGPIDTATWGYAVAGAAIGVILVLALLVAGGH